jgi:hypothetical protein
LKDIGLVEKDVDLLERVAGKVLVVSVHRLDLFDDLPSQFEREEGLYSTYLDASLQAHGPELVFQLQQLILGELKFPYLSAMVRLVQLTPWSRYRHCPRSSQVQ